jgi:spoIIIJ-associated protein
MTDKSSSPIFDTISQEKTKIFLQTFFEKMGYSNINVHLEQRDEYIDIQLHTQNAEELPLPIKDILLSMKILLRVYLISQGLYYKITLDLNDYRKKQIEQTIALTDRAVSSVEILNDTQKLPPMSGYFRRLVHLHLKDSESVITESHGEGLDRHIVIHKK